MGGLGGGFPPFEGRHPSGRREGCAQGGRARQVVQPRRSSLSVCLSVCLLRIELVRDGLTDRDETFGGDIWHCQERISLKPTRPVDIGLLLHSLIFCCRFLKCGRRCE